jgi:NAD(P)-dependent dehydrogenase (short-subunit alcohol dehydrogenase family)
VPLISYGATKAAVSMLTVQYAHSEPSIKFNCVAPGLTATDFTASSAGGQPPGKAAELVVRLASIGPDGPTGTFQETAGPLAW